jgi:hypothetical protein
LLFDRPNLAPGRSPSGVDVGVVAVSIPTTMPAENDLASEPQVRRDVAAMYAERLLDGVLGCVYVEVRFARLDERGFEVAG